MPQPTPIDELIAGKTSREAAVIKAQEIAARAASFLPYTYALNGVTVVVERLFYYAPMEMLAAQVQASDANGPLPLPDYMRGALLLFHNPPYKKGGGEDVIGAAEQFLYEIVVKWARDHGWSG